MTWQLMVTREAADELAALPADMRARFVHIAELLVQAGPSQVGMPHVKPLEKGLWEMRLTGRDGIARAIYTALSERRLVVLHVFIKKTQATPRRAIRTAQQRREALQP